MANFVATLTSQEMLPADNATFQTVYVQNLDAVNFIYIEAGGSAVAATSLALGPTSGTMLRLSRPPFTSIHVLADTAGQTAPADTRYLISG